MPIYALDYAAPAIDPQAFVHPDAVVIGAVELAAGASVWPGAVLRGDHGRITVGERTSVQDGTIVHTTEEHPTVIGADCVVGHRAHLEGCVVEDGCLIGSGSLVLDRARVGAGAVVAAAALVLEDMTVPAGALAVGVPASIRAGVGLRQQSWIKYAVQTYLDLAERHRTGLRRLDRPVRPPAPARPSSLRPRNLRQLRRAGRPTARAGNGVARTSRQLCAACRAMRATIHHAPQVGRGSP